MLRHYVLKSRCFRVPNVVIKDYDQQQLGKERERSPLPTVKTLCNESHPLCDDVAQALSNLRQPSTLPQGMNEAKNNGTE